MAQTSKHEYSQETATDIASLWQDALKEYCIASKLEFRHMKKFNSMADIDGDRDVRDKFFNFRDNGGKLAKLRSTISKNADLILSGAKCIADAASPAFPPSAAILTALTYVMKASQDVSKDYDKIVGFFEELQTFLERISILEEKLPTVKAYRSHVLRVFSAIMKMLGLATKATTEGRMKRFGKTMLRGGTDDELSGATGALDTAMKRLESATANAILAGVEDIKRDNVEIKGTVVTIVGLARDISTNLAEMNSTSRGTAQSMQSQAHQNFLRLSAQIEQMREERWRSLAQPTGSTPTEKKIKAARKPTSLNVVKRFFSSRDESSRRDEEFAFSLVEGTAQWLFNREEFISWKEGTSSSPYLWLKGEAGMGKSFLAYSAVRELKNMTAIDPNISVAHHYFQQGNFEDHSTNNEEAVLHSMLSAIVTQVARYDKAYCDQVATSIMTHENDTCDLSQTARFEEFIAFRFLETSSEKPHKNAAHCLFLVLDGLDEILNTSEVILECLKPIADSKWNIRVLLTSRPQCEEITKLAGVRMVTVTKNDVENDMKLIVGAQLKQASRLRKLRPAIKNTIGTKLINESDGLLHTDQALRRLNKYHQESSVLRALNELPNTLTSLYQDFEDEIASRRSPEELQTIKLVYEWIAHCKESISVDQIADIVKLRGLDKLFNIEEEITSRSGIVLTVTRDSDIAEDTEESGAGDMDEGHDSDTGTVLVTQLTASVDTVSIVRFHNRSLKDHFCEPMPKNGGIREPKSSAAFAIFEMCAHIVTNNVRGPLCQRTRQYAATNWALHFIDIELSSLTDQKVAQGISMLYGILSSANGVADFMEKHFVLTPNISPYAHIFMQPKHPEGSRLTRFQTKTAAWLHRAAGLDKDEFQPPLLIWIIDMMARPQKLLVELARGHVQNWRTSSGNRRTSYTFALSVLNYVSFRYPCPGYVRASWTLDKLHTNRSLLDRYNIKIHKS
jgi:hypothetical protein